METMNMETHMTTARSIPANVRLPVRRGPSKQPQKRDPHLAWGRKIREAQTRLRAMEANFKAGTSPYAGDSGAYEKAYDVIYNAMERLEISLVDTPATTLEGLRAQAEYMHDFLKDEEQTTYFDDRCLRSMVKALLNLRS